MGGRRLAVTAILDRCVVGETIAFSEAFITSVCNVYVHVSLPDHSHPNIFSLSHTHTHTHTHTPDPRFNRLVFRKCNSSPLSSLNRRPLFRHHSLARIFLCVRRRPTQSLSTPFFLACRLFLKPQVGYFVFACACVEHRLGAVCDMRKNHVRLHYAMRACNPRSPVRRTVRDLSSMYVYARERQCQHNEAEFDCLYRSERRRDLRVARAAV